MMLSGNYKQIFAPLLLIISALATILLTACATSQQNNYDNIGNAGNLPAQFNLNLAHSPVGTVDLSWNHANHVLKVAVTATGLAPSSTHPEHIHAGTCASNPMGPIVYTLNPLVADAHGDATSSTIIQGVNGGIPASGWYVNVHNGPTLATPLEARSIACATVNWNGSSQISDQQVHLSLAGTMDADEHARGIAQIQRDGDKVTVKLSINGLVPSSTHMAHIHAGTCTYQGAVIYPLNPVVADVNGHGTSTTTISSAKDFTTARLYINVHEAGTMSGMMTQQGFNPIACGNIG